MNRVNSTVLALAAVLLASCATQPSEREMNYLASALTKVSAAVDATVRYRRQPESLTEGEPFDGLSVRVLRSGRDSAVLVCQPQGKALLEDAGCTAKLDAHRWRTTGGGNQCAFTLDLDKVCAR
jgi:hypothetical protein